jgi:polyferredoxin
MVIAMSEQSRPEQSSPDASAKLKAIKAAHTAIWAFFAACVCAIPVAAWFGHLRVAASLGAVVLVEVLALLLNAWSCPLTAIAARYTNDRSANFDIYLPEWLARYNKLIFGSLYVAGVAFTLVQWAHSAGWP